MGFVWHAVLTGGGGWVACARALHPLKKCPCFGRMVVEYDSHAANIRRAVIIVKCGGVHGRGNRMTYTHIWQHTTNGEHIFAGRCILIEYGMPITNYLPTECLWTPMYKLFLLLSTCTSRAYLLNKNYIHLHNNILSIGALL
jgi:hypothetical protein